MFNIYRINGIWCLADANGNFLCSLIDKHQPSDRNEAERLLKLKYERMSKE